jgi:hypothetical protein
MSHTCNPSYSGGRDQKAHGSKPAQANSSRDLSQEKKKKSKAGEFIEIEKCKVGE